jgi:hypothetical protein
VAYQFLDDLKVQGKTGMDPYMILLQKDHLGIFQDEDGHHTR